VYTDPSSVPQALGNVQQLYGAKYELILVIVIPLRLNIIPIYSREGYRLSKKLSAISKLQVLKTKQCRIIVQRNCELDYSVCSSMIQLKYFLTN